MLASRESFGDHRRMLIVPSRNDDRIDAIVVQNMAIVARTGRNSKLARRMGSRQATSAGNTLQFCGCMAKRR